VQSVLVVGGKVYAATAGEGIWRYRDGALRRITPDGGVGPLVNVLYSSGDGVLVGTLDRGAFLVRGSSPEDVVVLRLADVVPALDAVNVTCFVEDGGTIWVGTYGEGLYRWDRETNSLSRFRKRDGSIPDDWILAGVATDRAVYFGTFGGGVAVFDKEARVFRDLGIADGLSSADVASVAYWKPHLYFGTLGGGVTVFDERGYETIP
jgi:ligand-binding sensor domain-containing protein